MFALCTMWLFLLFFANLTESVTPNSSLEETFRYCLLSQSRGTLGHCFGVGAMNKLQNLDNSPEFDLVDGVTLTKDAREFREAYNFAEGDPTSLRGLVDIMGNVFSRRKLEWNMGFLYPGLMLRVAPSINPGGHLEFILDAHREAINVQSLKEASTGRLLTRQFLLPLLLGFKFNIASLIPILFGALALLAKKALVICKLALVVVSAFGLGSLVFGYGNRPNYGYGGGHEYGVHQIHGYGLRPHLQSGYKYSEEEEDYRPYYKTVDDQPQDQVRLDDNLGNAFARKEHSQGRNFVWEEDVKNKPNAT